MGRTIGIILIAAGLIALLAIAGLMGTYGFVTDELTTGAAVLGITLGLFVIVLPLWGVGGFMLWSGLREEKAMAGVRAQRQLLNIVKTQGQVALSDIVIEMNSTRTAVKDMLYDLVGKGLFSGYINWDEGVLYSQQASELHGLTNCRHCNGQLELAGKGVINCPFCGTEYFLEA